MPFDNEEKIVMFPQSTLDAIGLFIELHGQELPVKPSNPQGEKAKVVCGRLDRQGSSDIRPCRFPQDTNPILLTNGQWAFKAFWSQSLIDTINAGSPNASIITQEEFDTLKPPPSDDI